MKSSRPASQVETPTVIDGLDLTRLHQFTHEYVGDLLGDGTTAVQVTVTLPRNGFREAVGDLLEWKSVVESSDNMMLVRSAKDLAKAKNERRLGIILGMQDSHACEGDTRFAQVFHFLGLRIMQLTYNRMNLAGTGCSERTDAGLSTFGRELVRELNSTKVLIDLSHASDRTVLDTLEASVAPTIVSHTGCRKFTGRSRAASDEILRAVAEQGGVVGILATSLALRQDALENAATLSDYLDHLEHALTVAGPTSVGVGLDIVYPDVEGEMLELMRRYPDWKRPTLETRYVSELYRPGGRFHAISSGMAQRGIDDETIENVLGGNFERVFGQVWDSPEQPRIASL